VTTDEAEFYLKSGVRCVLTSGVDEASGGNTTKTCLLSDEVPKGRHEIEAHDTRDVTLVRFIGNFMARVQGAVRPRALNFKGRRSGPTPDKASKIICVAKGGHPRTNATKIRTADSPA